MSADLVLLHHNEPMTTSLAIAEGTQNTHKAVIQLVRKYVDDLQEFGTLAFEMRKSGGMPTEVAFLNEPQATLLITYLRNTDTVRRFKIALVKAFYELRDRLRSAAQPQFVTGNLAHGADLAVAADRTFRSFLRSARTAGLKLPQALRLANAQTLARTGMDMLAALDVDPSTVPAAEPAPVRRAPADPLEQAVAAWIATAGEGPWLMADILHEAAGVTPADRRFDSMAIRAAQVLRGYGFFNRKMRCGGRPRNYWQRMQGQA